MKPCTLAPKSQNFKVLYFWRNFRVSFKYSMDIIWDHFLQNTSKNWFIHCSRCCQASPMVQHMLIQSLPNIVKYSLILWVLPQSLLSFIGYPIMEISIQEIHFNVSRRISSLPHLHIRRRKPMCFKIFTRIFTSLNYIGKQL